MPNHKRGYTQRGKGYLPTDKDMAQNYERRAENDPTIFDEALSRALIEELIASCEKIKCRLHAASTEPTHIHALTSWKHERGWMSIRTSLKTSLTKRLKTVAENLSLSRAASRKHVRERRHFNYLMNTYLPKHHGLAWYEDRAWVTQSGSARRKRR
ncbi:MAG: hypothetical protein QOF78_321 [Phycisphaerales bacterium]|jgi:REP element-mobilizing transposase RayT|nr:hypothetical protein [Phycisphaerales bacterium]